MKCSSKLASLALAVLRRCVSLADRRAAKKRGQTGETSPMVQCDVCALRTAVVYCSADQAHLCSGCDLDVHSANAMSARHVREPLPVGFPRHGPPRLANNYHMAL